MSSLIIISRVILPGSSISFQYSHELHMSKERKIWLPKVFHYTTRDINVRMRKKGERKKEKEL